MLPAEVHAELTQLLQALQSSDNSIRSQAEDHLTNNWTATRPEVLLMGLAEQIAASADASVYTLCTCPRARYLGRLTNALSHVGTILRRCHIPSNRFKESQK